MRRFWSRRSFWITAALLAAVLCTLPGCANAEPTAGAVAPATNDASSVSIGDQVHGLIFDSRAGRWRVAEFAQARQGAEFYFGNRLYRVIGEGRAAVVLDVDPGKLAEADLPADGASHRPTAADVVQLLDKNMRFAAHTAMSDVQPGAGVRFQGKTWRVDKDGKLTEQANPAVSALQRIEITQAGLQHVYDRHTTGGSMNRGKSIFSASESVPALIKGAELLAPTAQARGNCVRIMDAGRAIGIDRATGRQTSVYTVVTTESGKLVTAFPGTP